MTPKEILQSVDWPGSILVLDFECFFTTGYSLQDEKKNKGLSNVEYVTHPLFEFTGLGLRCASNGMDIFIPGPQVPWAVSRLQKKFGENLQNVTVVAKNTKFDVLILAEKFGIYPPHVIDIEDLSRYFDSRMKQDLKSLAKHFKIPPKGDTNQFKGQHCVDIDWTAMKKYCLQDVEDESLLLDILLPMLDNPETELQLMQHTLNLYLKPTLRLDTDLAHEIRSGMDEALAEDLDAVSWIVDIYGSKKKSDVASLLRATSLFPKILAEALPDGEEVPMKLSPKPYKKTGKHEMIPALAKDDEAFQLLLAHPNELVRNLCTAKAACSSWSGHQLKVKNLIAQTECSGGKVRIPIKFYACHTGRWGGTQKWNPLNLGTKTNRKTGVDYHPLIAKVRNTLLAPPGYKLIIDDSRQIEARELPWIAGQNDLVENFRNSIDSYSLFATEVFGESVWDPTKEELLTPEGKIAKIRRGFGKDAVLGCGFGMGTNTFFQNCRKNVTLRPMFDSGEYDWAFIDKLIKTYRKTYPMIPKFWRKVEKSFRWVTKYPREVCEYHIPGTDIRIDTTGRCYTTLAKPILRFWKEGSTTIIQLPSGRRLFYRHATVSKDNQIKYIHGHLWGGAICMAGHTPVLTNKGIRRMDCMTDDCKVWDGYQWVGHSGLKFNGKKRVIGLNGLDVTPDHRVMTTKGWFNAAETHGFTWKKVRLPDRDGKSWLKRETLAVARKMQLWEDVSYARKRLDQEAGDQVLQYVQPSQEGQEQDARHDKPSRLLGVAVNARQMSLTITPRLGRLWRAGYLGLRTMGKVISEFLERHGGGVHFWSYFGQDRQRRKLRARQLPLGYVPGASHEQTQQPGDRHPITLGEDWHKSKHSVLQTQPRKTITPVYDLIDCGSNHCFTVLDADGHLRLVHNCENIIQSICRDLLTFWLLECEKRGIPIVLHTYDELVGCVPEDQADEKLEEMTEIMRVGPDWAAGLPLDAEGGVSPYYKK